MSLKTALLSSSMLQRFNTIGVKLVATVGTALVLLLAGSFLFLLQRRMRLDREDFIRELSTITSYAESVREYLAEHQRVFLRRDTVYTQMPTVPIIAAWQTAQKYAEGKGYTFRTPSLNARASRNEPDGFERQALERFARDSGAQQHFEETALDGHRVFRYAVPVRLTKDCLRCHGGVKGEADEFGHPKEGMREGELKGAFVVTAPMTFLDARRRSDRIALAGVGVATIFAITVILMFVVRRITSPLNELVGATRTLGEGKLEGVAPVRSGDEVGQLARAFNEMAAKLRASYENLEEKVEARTSELKRSQAQLLQAAKLASIGELVGGIAHEINNPTGVIVMRAATLMEDAKALGLSEDLLSDIEAIQRQSSRLATITSGLLQFSRQSPFAPTPVDLNRVVERPISFVEPTLRNRGIACHLDLDESLPLVSADATRIEQVLLNLYTNAIDAMPGGGKLTVQTRHVPRLEAGEGGRPAEASKAVSPGEDGRGEWVMISVRDTGEGIQSENLTRIFDPFFTTKEVGKGTGLGLAISYGIVQEHGGRIEVESRWGHGAEFRVYLPAVKDKA
jgi:signal transduction histidine kinase